MRCLKWAHCHLCARTRLVSASKSLTRDFVMGGDFPQLQMTALSGQHVRLEPLQALHLEALISIGSDPAIWTWYPDSAATPEGMRHFVDVSLAARDAGTALP